MDPRGPPQQQSPQHPPHQQQHTYSRPPERPLIHNPNHQTAPGPPPPPPPAGQHPGYPYGPHASQPPVHVPFQDPFPPRRDPFLPSAQSQQRRGSYSLSSRDAPPGTPQDRTPLGGGWHNASGTPSNAQQQAAHPQPALPTTQSSSAPSSAYGYDSSRRRSLGGGSPPRYYGVPHEPPPPPSFGSRHMPPPSSPQQQSPMPSYASGRAGPAPSPAPPSFPHSRDLPGLGSGHRPGSSMSISSLIGSEPPSVHQPPQHSPPTSSTAVSPSTKAMQPPSPRRTYHAASRSEYGSYPRPEAADKYAPSAGSTPRLADMSAQLAGSPPRGYGSARASPERGRPPVPQSQPPYQSGATGPSNPYPPRESAELEPGRSTVPGVPRPNSQPTGSFPPPARDGEPRDRYDPVMKTQPRPHYRYGPAPDRRPYAEHQHHQHHSHQQSPPTSAPAERPPPPPQIGGEQDRPITVQPVAHSAYSPPQGQPRSVPHQQAPPPPPPPPQAGPYWRGVPKEDSREQSGPRESNFYRNGPGGLRHNGSEAPSSSGTPSDASSRPSQDHLGRRGEHFHPVPVAHDHVPDPRRNDHSASHTPSGPGYGPRPPYEGVPRRPGEEMQHSRSFLGVSSEMSRRTGRASPLPQAVHGAQAKHQGPGEDPNIKSEFGRMFSGLGAGLSSVPSGNGGTNTPSRGSPMPTVRPMEGREPIPSLGADMARDGSRGIRKARRIKEEDGKAGSESGDGRGTPTLGGPRAAKRPKHAHTAHHHHHHHPHSHHHHHHKPEDDVFNNGSNASPAGAILGPYNAMKIPPQPPQAGTTPTPHHHHHHHHHAPPPVAGGPVGSAIHPHQPHHHHHPPKPSPVPGPSATPAAAAPPPPRVASPRRPPPTTTIISQPVIDSVAHLPRQHLGSGVYKARPTLPASATTPLDAKNGYTSRPNPMPRFDGKENCTFTVRVHRYYLTADQREVITSSRFLWGTGIYTDDSDVVAMAIHEGWIRGEWGADVDVGMLGIKGVENGINGAAKAGKGGVNHSKVGNGDVGDEYGEDEDEVPTVMTAPPATGPVVPPRGHELHVTLLILPPLQRYASTTANGIRSREWGRSHDGMSVKIVRMEWVDEGWGSRGEERSGEAKRKRMAAESLMDLFKGKDGAEAGPGERVKGRVAVGVA